MDLNVNFSEVRIILILCHRVVVTFSVWCSKDFIPFQLHLMLHTQTVYRPVSRYPKLINFECFDLLVNSAFNSLPNSNLTFITWTLLKQVLWSFSLFCGYELLRKVLQYNKYCKSRLSLIVQVNVVLNRTVVVDSD